jgi:hypothetical protein
MNEPPEGSDDCNRISLFVSLSNFLTKRLCPNTPPLSHAIVISLSVSITTLAPQDSRGLLSPPLYRTLLGP